MPDAAAVLELHDVEKQYGALRPLRVRNLRILRGTRCTLMGLDLPAAETFVNLITGAVLPETGEVITLGQRTSSIISSEAWLRFVEQFGFVSDRIALLDAFTVAQNLANHPNFSNPASNINATNVGVISSTQAFAPARQIMLRGRIQF